MLSNFLALIFLLTACWVCLATLGCMTYEALADDKPLAIQLIATLNGDMAYPDELSGVAIAGDLVVVTPDEGAALNVFERRGSGYELLATPSLLPDADEEIDMEAAAADGEFVYVVGSHSMRRKKVDEDSAYKKNRKRLARVTPHESSYSLFRIRLDDDGGVESSQELSLAKIIEDDEILGLYAAIPGKENGVDIEGLAVQDGRLFVGFRGPVLRGNFVPVLSFSFETPQDYELSYVKLAGRGVRDLLAVEGGFLVLAGPIGDGDASYRLYFWNGADCVPGDEGPHGELQALSELPHEKQTKPEGLALLEETDVYWRVLMVSDGDARASVVTAAKP